MMPWEDVDFRIKFDPEINKLNSLQFDLIKEGKTKEAWEVCCKRSELESSKKCKLEKKREEARIRIEERNKEIDKKINEIYKKINEIREEKRIELEREYNAIVKDLEEGVFKDEIWQSVIDNQEDLKSYLSQKYDERITTFWLKDSDDCRAYLQFRKTFDGLVETFIEQEKTGKRFLESERYANFKSMTGLLLGGEEVEEWIYNIKECFEKEWKEEEHRILKEWEEEENKRKQKMLEEEKRLEIYRFNIRNAHHRDSNIKIRQSDHTYIVNGVALDSVTNFVEGCFPKFDTEFYAEKKAAEMGVSVKSVLDMWEQKAKESRDLGTALHKRIEDYYQDITFAPNDDKAFDLFKQFANKVTLKPYRTEWAVYDLKHNIAGTIDFVDFQNGEYIIYDWKRSQKIIENGMPIKKDKYGKNGNYPLEHLDNSAYYHYALQLSLYKYILENNYGIKISDLRLGVFHPAYDKPYVLRMPYLEKEINDLFGLRSEILF